MASQDGILGAAPESERRDPVSGSTGHKVPVASNDGEDDEGRSDNERLVVEGFARAEHDQMVQAHPSSRERGQPRVLALRLARAMGGSAKCTLHRQSSCRLQ
jgi:hypothetical protein